MKDKNSAASRYDSKRKGKGMPPRRTSRTITFSLPPEMFDQVWRVKDGEGRNMTELVREALRMYMEDRELHRRQRRAMNPTTMAAPLAPYLR